MTRMIRTRCLAVVAGVLTGAPAGGQSINVDYGDGSGTPASDFAAAGLPGVWNTLSGGPGVPEPLVGLDGRPLAATVAYSLSSTLSADDPATSGNDERLLDDGVVGFGDVAINVTFADLDDGTYEVIIYGWTPQLPGDSTLFIIDDLGAGETAGGPWPGGFQEGVTHVVHTAEVTGGTMNIIVVGGFWGATGFLNGIQLRQITPGDVNGDCLVNVLDLIELLLCFGQAGEAQCALADINGDGDVNVLDLIELLLQFGTAC